MKTLKALLFAVALALISVGPAAAAFPWGVLDPLEVSGATPTCTYTATNFMCFENMTANVSSLTLAGMTKGTTYAIAWIQDGTGSRTLTQTPITASTGGPAVPAIPSAANKWTVWIITATSASAASFVSNWDNVTLFDSLNQTPGSTGMVVTSNGTNVATLAMQAQPTLVFPGVTASTPCQAYAQTLPATWQTGIQLACLPSTNLLTPEELNPSAASVTPAAVTLSVRIAQP